MILVIDNNETQFMGNIRSILKKNSCRYKVKNFRKVTMRDAKGVDAIILSGGVGSSSDLDSPDYLEEINIVMRSGKPIFGICLGFEIICHVYGFEVESMPYLEKGVVTIEIREKDLLFKNCSSTMNVFEWHRDKVNNVGKYLKVLATSKDGIEAIKHRTKPIYGVQFHPSLLSDNEGYKTLENFLKLIS
jgi:GMP synthase (glutamine-hydrolysing)